ncbi:MAG: response regulator transcription factor [Halanaerobiales bacterium]
MIIDNEVQLCKSLKEYLGEENHIVEIVHEGAMGIDNIMNNNYDIIILDIILPDMDGIEVITYLREKGNDTPIVIISEKSKPNDIINGLDKGADDYLRKPFNPGELLARLRALYRRWSNVLKEDSISFSNITLNKSTVELFSQDQKQSLTQKEFELMNLFINNPHHVLRKDMIISKLWPIDDDVAYNTLEAHISSLRRKMELITSVPKIVTVRGIGYKLVE